MNKMLLTLSLSLFCTSSFGSALVSGTILPPEMNPEQTCKIRSHNLNEAFTCSGTLIGEKTLITAAHCKAGFGFLVGCKGKDGTIYKSKVARFVKIETGLDLAVIELKDKIPLTPMKMVQTLKNTESLLQTGRCRFSGWSEGKKLTTVATPTSHAYTLTEKLDESRERIVSALAGDEILVSGQSTKIENISFNTTAEHPTLAGDSTNAIAHGDSGGSTFCLNEKNEPILIGVNRAGNGKISDAVAIGTDSVQNWLLQLGIISN